MRKIYLACTLILALAACENKPLPVSLLEAPQAVYGQLEKNPYLSGKISVGEFKYRGKRERLAPLYLYTDQAVANGLRKAGYLANDPAQAKYTLSGEIKDVQWPACLFASCDTGSAIEYTMINKDEYVAYHEMLVVPYTYERPLMGGDEVMILQQGLGGAIGNNIAHLLHVLNQKTKSDLQ